ncbi:MAG: hypothetical protein ACXVEE_39640 [Polyangiales bacterium]
MRRFALLSVVLSIGCSLDTTGSATDIEQLADSGDITADTSTSPGDDSSTPDTGSSETEPLDSTTDDTGTPPADTGTPPTDTGTPPPMDTGGCDTSACGDPGGAKRLALVDRSKACPAGFIQTDFVEDKGGDACSCACNLAAMPFCPGNGDIATKFGAGGCGSTGLTLHPSGTDVCTGIGMGGNLAAWFSGTAPSPIGGACGPMANTNKGAITRQLRLCEPISGTCAAPICAAPFTECIETAGTCPAGYPNPRSVGYDISVICPSCTCSLDAGSCTGSLTLFNNGSCGMKVATLAVDGTCVETMHAGDGVNSYKYKPDAVKGASCGSSFTSSPGTRSTVGARNLCCR